MTTPLFKIVRSKDGSSIKIKTEYAIGDNAKYSTLIIADNITDMRVAEIILNALNTALNPTAMMYMDMTELKLKVLDTNIKHTQQLLAKYSHLDDPDRVNFYNKTIRQMKNEFKYISDKQYREGLSLN